ncbi:MAG: DUF3768 domain-containing protein [Gammaproteobacteria bacterium]|nr:DUF3768 domain-containing protein [Gammaproteobacteria bacterium]
MSDSEVAAIVAAQNDAFRKSAMQLQQAENVPKGRVVMTQGISAQSPDFLLELTRKVVTFDAFGEDCDPHGWHEMGVMEIAGETVWFKIDLYDTNYEYGSADPTDLEQTCRVLTLLFPSEY